jgi:ferrochelatase
MRYSRPFSTEAVERLRARGADRIIGLPLYPQFSHSTSGSSLTALTRAIESLCPGLPCTAISHWCDDPDHHLALARRILARRRRMAREETVGLLLVAHSVPEKFVLRGDPYVEHVERTVEGVLNVLDREWSPSFPWMIAYQSQVGPIKWVGPTVVQALEAMQADGIRSVIVAPVSFVSDHLETLYDIDLEIRRKALELGFERFERIESLNAGDDFLAVLAGLVIRVLTGTIAEPEEAGSSKGDGKT